jgi:hypothetical protein
MDRRSNSPVFFCAYVTEILLTIILITVLVLSYLERKDLNNRLMAKSLEDLRNNTQKDEDNNLKEEEKEIDLEDARDEVEELING